MFRLKINEMYKANQKLMLILLIFYITVGIAVGFGLFYLAPSHYFFWYPVIPAYYTIIGFSLFRCLIVCRKNNPKKMINVYMMMRAVKFLVTIGSILVYVLISEEDDYEFSITTVGFYFFYLFIETYIYINFEKEKGKENEEKKENICK